MANVLLVEDDKDMTELLRHTLQEAGHILYACSTGKEGLSSLQNINIDLILLDLMLPDMDGFEICRRLREQNVRQPIMMLTSRSEELDKVLGLELGADDYITKPFGIRELQARIKALLRRTDSSASTTAQSKDEIIQDDFYISKQKKKAAIKGERLELTAKEFDLLYLLASNPGKTFSRFELLESVWGYSFEGYEHTVTSHINRLRIKMEPDINKPRYILTTWGKGYRFSE
jgi:two-component system, OmpR family, alkaline phosphatase synthesis response regulator PhoP